MPTQTSCRPLSTHWQRRVDAVQAAADSLHSISSSLKQEAASRTLMKLAFDKCSRPVCLAVEHLKDVTFDAGQAAKRQLGANNPQNPAGHLLTMALEWRLCEGLSTFLGWFVSGLERPDCRSEEFWQLADTIVEAMTGMLMLADLLAQGRSQCLFQQVQAQLVDADEPVTS
eukprot:jgi/Chrzof1/14707/Cz09g12230.t1